MLFELATCSLLVVNPFIPLPMKFYSEGARRTCKLTHFIYRALFNILKDALHDKKVKLEN